jgi:hypothetical protein
METLGSHLKTQFFISATINSSLYCVIPSYKYLYKLLPNSGFKILSPGIHEKILSIEFYTALTLIFLSSLNKLLYSNDSS